MKMYHYLLIFGGLNGQPNRYVFVSGESPLCDGQIAQVHPFGHHLVACTFLGMSGPIVSTPGGGRD